MFDLVPQLAEIAASEGDGPDARERCGVFVQDGKKARLVELPNIHNEPTKFFEIDPNEIKQFVADGTLLAMWHTHPNGQAAPSMADLKTIEAWGIPCHIVSWPEGGHSYTEPSGYVAPYERRPFVHGILDCYSLIRDWYAREFGIVLDDIKREPEWWEKPIDEPGANMYVDHFESQGFVQLPIEQERDLQLGDVLLIQALADRPNHGAIYLGNEVILHHVFGRLSERTIYGGYWAKNMVIHLRHKSKM